VKALDHPTAGVRRAAAQVLPRTPWANQAILRANLAEDDDPHVRLTAVLALSEMPRSNGLGQKLYSLSQEENIQGDNWLARATYAAAAHHREGFMNTYLTENPEYEDVQVKKASMVPREHPNHDDSDWNTMQLPQLIEDAGLDIDGVVWFRKKITIPDGFADQAGMISLGPINDSDETWVNGIKVGGLEDSYDKDRKYVIPARVLKAGENTVVVRVQDNQNVGGFSGEANQLFVQVGNRRISLVGDWRYEVGEEFGRETKNIFEGEQTIASLLMDTYWNRPEEPVAEVEIENEDAIIVQIKTVKNAMKYDIGEFVVEAGRPVKIIFENPDFMQHNLLIIQPGTLETVGAAADKLASNPQGADMQYVPDMEEVMYNTPLVDPGATVELTFTAPENPDEYPFVCTFPGHWRIMQGTMKVVNPQAI